MAGKLLTRHDESYVRLHNQHGVKTGQYMPPVPRGMLNTTIDLMRFRERIENEEGAVAQWHDAFGRWNWTNTGTLSEYAQRSFNLSSQIHEPSQHRPFFESLIRRRGKVGSFERSSEGPEETYTRQTGLHHRRPLACESSFRLHNVDRSTQTTPESAGGRAASAGKSQAVNHRQSMPYYLRERRFAESWHPFSEPNLRMPGVNAAMRRAEH